MHIGSLRGDYSYQQEAMISPANPCVLFQLVPAVRPTSPNISVHPLTADTVTPIGSHRFGTGLDRLVVGSNMRLRFSADLEDHVVHNLSFLTSELHCWKNSPVLDISGHLSNINNPTRLDINLIIATLGTDKNQTNDMTH